MSKGTIKYSQEFKSEYGNKWIGIDMVVNDGEDWNEKYKEAEAMVQSWGGGWMYSASYKFGEVDYNGTASPVVIQPITTSSIPTIDPRAYETAEIAIDNATTIQDLEFYADIAVKYGLVEMYLNKKNALETMPFPK